MLILKVQRKLFLGGAARDASTNHFSLRRVQTKKLQYNEKQEKRSGQIILEKILSILQETYSS